MLLQKNPHNPQIKFQLFSDYKFTNCFPGQPLKEANTKKYF